MKWESPTTCRFIIYLIYNTVPKAGYTKVFVFVQPLNVFDTSAIMTRTVNWQVLIIQKQQHFSPVIGMLF